MSTYLEKVRSVAAACSASLAKHGLPSDLCVVSVLISRALLKEGIDSDVITGYAIFDTHGERRTWVSVKESSQRTIIIDLTTHGRRPIYKALLPYGMPLLGKDTMDYRCVEIDGWSCITDHTNIINGAIDADSIWRRVACDLLL